MWHTTRPVVTPFVKQNFWSKRLGLTCASLLMACRAAPLSVHLRTPSAAVRQAIIGGANIPDGNEPEIFMLLEIAYFPSGDAEVAVCSSTMVAPQALLTAAHCVDPAANTDNDKTPASSLEVWATNTADNSTLMNWIQTQGQDITIEGLRGQMLSAGFIQADSMAPHPNWSIANLQEGEDNLMYDIGMVHLGSAPSDAAVIGYADSTMTSAIAGLQGSKIRLLGFGISDASDDSGAGVLREIDIAAGTVHPGIIDTGNGTDAICHGDSGGPSFFDFPDGVPRIVGVHSFTNTATNATTCQTGGDTRVDVFADFVTNWIASNGENTNTATDVGHPCSDDSECSSNQCIDDPQHTDNYCTAACVTDKDCPRALVCRSELCIFPQLPYVKQGQSCADGVALCATGFDCLVMSDGTQKCNQLCTQDTDCTVGFSCTVKIESDKYCGPTPISPTTDPVNAEKSSNGCHNTGDAPLWLVTLAAVLLRLRRPRGAR